VGNVIIKIEVDRNKLITILIYGLPLYFFIRDLNQHLGWVSQVLHCVKPSTPRHWRGKQLSPHGCSVCDSFCVLWLLSHHLKFVMCKKMVQHNLRDKVNAVTSCFTLACTTPMVHMFSGRKVLAGKYCSIIVE
jgi:hypothetical protein